MFTCTGAYRYSDGYLEFGLTWQVLDDENYGCGVVSEECLQQNAYRVKLGIPSIFD
jgi:hypothetical protein